MRIVKGRGSRRNTFELPCATIVNRSPVQEQEQVKNILCDMMGIDVVSGEAPVRHEAEAA